MKVLNYGSLNVDYVYRVEHIARPGETISGESFRTFAGGKGANQSVALARAGASAIHAGKVGKGGEWLKENLTALGVDTRFTRVSPEPTGHAIIQVDDAGENAIFLFPGTNRQQTRAEIDETLAAVPGDTVLLLQNEINEIPYIMEHAHRKGFKICLNPAPYGPEIRGYPLDLVDILIFNETEGGGLVGKAADANGIVAAVASVLPRADLVLTLGEQGVLFRSAQEVLRVPAVRTRAVDTTAAGDTFIGYFLASRARGEPIRRCLEMACRAAAICVSRPGAADSIPARHEVEAWPAAGDG
jgi:ribokinase